MSQGRIFSGMRPTGKLHIGHLSVLENWVKLQDSHECFFGIVDWHALTTAFDNPATLPEHIMDMALDWLSVGLDPEKSAIFVQSHVKQHGELHLLLSMITPLSWLERVPTYKDQIQQLNQQGKDINTYGFLGYPLLMAADILVYRANLVPVGVDQLPHLELCREVARRFNYLYQVSLFPEPQAALSRENVLPGTDGRKMSKSYGNEIAIGIEPKELAQKVRQMVTDPARIRKDDPGHPEVCVVHTYHEFYDAENVASLGESCRAGEIGCVECKKRLTQKLEAVLAPIREKRLSLEQKPEWVKEILIEGQKRAALEAEKTMALAREAMSIK
ncbi:MAG: tryptophan--tRNA ligase [Clostridia bacterium]|jgi:tryptophanyl-tRNA synthetase|nr:tryptophan--tRNA ligase [Clostridia bacterium]